MLESNLDIFVHIWVNVFEDDDAVMMVMLLVMEWMVSILITEWPRSG